MYAPGAGRHSSGPAPDPEDEARLLFRMEQPDKETERNLLGMLPGAAFMAVVATIELAVAVAVVLKSLIGKRRCS
jgi:hypothetical protein